VGRQPAVAAGQEALHRVLLRPVRQGNAFEETVERLLDAIKLGLVGFGERLPPERELAPRLGVSRVTLREATRSLADAGVVEVRRGRSGGTFVRWQPARPSLADVRRIAADMGEDLEDALVLRSVVEPGAAAAAARRSLTADERTYLTGRLRTVGEAAPTGYRAADTAFHLALAELTGSRSVLAAATDVRARLNDLLAAIPLLERNLRHSNEQHRAIADAVLAGDAEAARGCCAVHLDATASLLRGFLSR
jgi:GntR family transcriptional regulator, transcriptional repressor for pyruvate dehydrogenase complex